MNRQQLNRASSHNGPAQDGHERDARGRFTGEPHTEGMHRAGSRSQRGRANDRDDYSNNYDDYSNNYGDYDQPQMNSERNAPNRRGANYGYGSNDDRDRWGSGRGTNARYEERDDRGRFAGGGQRHDERSTQRSEGTQDRP